MDKPKSYKIQNGCHNCAWVDRNAVAASVYPVCTAHRERFMAENYAICKRWEIYVGHIKYVRPIS